MVAWPPLSTCSPRDAIVHGSDVVIDRPRGSAHPRFPAVIYPLDYGFLEGTSSGDGQAIDVFVGTAVGAGVCGVAVIADPLKRDSEIKVLLDCAPGEVEVARAFLLDLKVGVALLPRPTSTS